MHKDMHPLLNAYLDGELQGTRLQEFKNHLASCEICQGELKELGSYFGSTPCCPHPRSLCPQNVSPPILP